MTPLEPAGGRKAPDPISGLSDLATLFSGLSTYTRRRFGSLRVLAGRNLTALVLLAGLGSLAAPIALAVAIVSSQAGPSSRPIVTCSNTAPLIVAGRHGLQARTLLNAYGANMDPRRLAHPGLRMIIITKSLRLDGRTLLWMKPETEPALPSVAPKI